MSEPPTRRELDMAMLWTVINACRGFLQVPGSDITPAEQRFLDEWRKIPAKRRQAALDHVEPLPSRPAKADEVLPHSELAKREKRWAGRFVIPNRRREIL